VSGALFCSVAIRRGAAVTGAGAEALYAPAGTGMTWATSAHQQAS
jgi:hypothetical protein